jgi:hypothetical protein
MGYEIIADKKRHLITVPYNAENLLAACEKLGIRKCWIHYKVGKTHIDIPKYLNNDPNFWNKINKVVSTSEIIKIMKEYGRYFK